MMQVTITRKTGATYRGRLCAAGSCVDVDDETAAAWMAMGIATEAVRAAAIEHEGRTPTKPVKAPRTAKKR
jgi:hypothetical protein